MSLAAVGLVVSALVTGCGSDEPEKQPRANSTAAAGLVDICASGAEDGSFTYISQLEPEAWQQVYEEFTAAFPGIEVSYTSLDAADTTERVLTAALAGRDLPADLVLGGTISLNPLVEEGLVNQTVDWTELGVPEEAITEQGYISVARVAYGLAYNPEVVPEEEMPSTWEELLDPKWKGQVIVDPRGYPFRDLSVVWGLEATLDYLERFKEIVDPLPIAGGTAGITAVLNGEALIATQGRQDSVAQLQAEGAPIEIKYLDVVSQDTDAHLLLKDTPHRDAAACFAGWLASPEGQQVFEEVDGKTNEERPDAVPDDVPMAVVLTKEQVDVANQVIEAMAAMWSGS